MYFSVWWHAGRRAHEAERGGWDADGSSGMPDADDVAPMGLPRGTLQQNVRHQLVHSITFTDN